MNEVSMVGTMATSGNNGCCRAFSLTNVVTSRDSRGVAIVKCRKRDCSAESGNEGFSCAVCIVGGQVVMLVGGTSGGNEIGVESMGFLECYGHFCAVLF